ncbi:MAG TPA: hypothetical protein VFS16_17545 [Acidimicrobiia bacterium]|nr:hypothetical protein [Acidimicrobiia bacterium]
MRRLTVLLVATFLVLLHASPAGAAQVIAADPKGDGVGPGDVRAVNVEHHSDVLRLRVRTEHPIALRTSPAWHRQGSLTRLRIFLDVDPTFAGPDWFVVIKASTGEVQTSLVPLTEQAPRDGCIPSVGQPQPTIIQAAFGVGCVRSNGYVRAYASYRFDQGGDGTVQSVDRAPNAGFGPKLVLVP